LARDAEHQSDRLQLGRPGMVAAFTAPDPETELVAPTGHYFVVDQR
jgi:hypothetical protein